MWKDESKENHKNVRHHDYCIGKASNRVPFVIQVIIFTTCLGCLVLMQVFACVVWISIEISPAVTDCCIFVSRAHLETLNTVRSALDRSALTLYVVELWVQGRFMERDVNAMIVCFKQTDTTCMYCTSLPTHHQ